MGRPRIKQYPYVVSLTCQNPKCACNFEIVIKNPKDFTRHRKFCTSECKSQYLHDSTVGKRKRGSISDMGRKKKAIYQVSAFPELKKEVTPREIAFRAALAKRDTEYWSALRRSYGIGQ